MAQKSKNEIIKERDIIISQIKKYSPLMRPFFESEDDLYNFSNKLYDFHPHPTHKERQKPIVQALRNIVERIFGPGSPNRLKLDLSGALAFNIADHHQVLSHPFLLSANFISSINKFFQKEKQPAIVVISSGDVPPNNYFSKSGFILHGKKIPLFSVAEREYCTYFIPARKFDFVERIKAAKRWQEFTLNELEFLEQHQQDIAAMNVAQCRDYSEQISIIVKNTWPLLFEEKNRANLPELIYITQEELTTHCLLNILKEDNIISRTLFDQSFQKVVLNNFRGIVVAWNEREQKGTHFFWRKYPERPRSIRMYLEDGKLVPQHEKFKHLSVNLEKSEILEMLEKREIYPSLFLIFSVLNFYAGVKPLTGFGSAVYLSLFKDAWIKSLKELGEQKEANLVSQVETNGLIAGLATFFRKYQDKTNALYAHDIFCDGPLSEEYLKSIFSMKYSDLLSIGAADMYDYFASKYIPKEEKINKTINFNDIARITFENI